MPMVPARTRRSWSFRACAPCCGERVATAVRASAPRHQPGQQVPLGGPAQPAVAGARLPGLWEDAAPSSSNVSLVPVLALGSVAVCGYTVIHRPPPPGFATPHAVGIAEMDGGWRLVAAVHNDDQADLRLGSRVDVELERVDSELTLPWLVMGHAVGPERSALDWSLP
jgi:hypothetical protein